MKITKLDKRKRVYRKSKRDIRTASKTSTTKLLTERTNSAIVIEDLSEIRNSIDYGSKINGILHKCSFRRFQEILEEKAKERGILVKRVNPSYDV